MITWYTLTGITLCVFLFSLIRYIRLRRAYSFSKHSQTAKSNTPFFGVRPRKQVFIVGVLTPMANEAALFLERGLTAQLEQTSSANYEIRMYHGNNDRVTLFNNATTILKDCDILIPFGLTCSNISYEAARHLSSTKPIIFAGMKASHIPLLRCQNQSTTLSGIISRSDHLTHLNQLRTLKPAMKDVLILYRQQQEWLIQEVKDMAENLKKNGIGATPHLLAHGTHIDNQLGALHHPFDTIILMPHTLGAKGINELVTYCNIKGVTLCAHEIDAVTLGAAVGFGAREIAIGNRVGRAIRDTLEIKKTLTQESLIEHIDHCHVHINTRVLEKQNLKLCEELLFLLNQGEVTHHLETGLKSTISPKNSSSLPITASANAETQSTKLSRFFGNLSGRLF